MSHLTTSIHAQAGLHRKLVLFCAQLEGYLRHFPNCHKYALTQSIRVAFIEMYNLVTEAQKRFVKRSALVALDIKHEQLRMLINLAHEMGLFAHAGGKPIDKDIGTHRFITISAHVDEIGKMIGGWIQKEFRSDAEKSSGLANAGAVGA